MLEGCQGGRETREFLGRLYDCSVVHFPVRESSPFDDISFDIFGRQVSIKGRGMLLSFRDGISASIKEGELSFRDRISARAVVENIKDSNIVT